MASFQTKSGSERLRKKENKNYRSNQLLHDTLQRIPKKFKKLENTIMATFKAKSSWERP